MIGTCGTAPVSTIEKNIRRKGEGTLRIEITVVDPFLATFVTGTIVTQYDNSSD
jgi:hypothetical protein